MGGTSSNLRTSILTKNEGGRVNKFEGGYINPDDIEAEIEMAKTVDGEILTQKEAIERIVKKLLFCNGCFWAFGLVFN